MGRFISSNGVHRKLEGWPLVFTILTTLSILVGGLVQFLPLVLVPSSVDRIATVEPWTPLELEGRDIYIAEGCNTCHSQMVRPFRHEIERYGREGGGYSKAGETVYERPFLWGSKRTGPGPRPRGSPPPAGPVARPAHGKPALDQQGLHHAALPAPPGERHQL